MNVLEKMVSKTKGKDTQQEPKSCCLTWILCNLHYLLRHCEEGYYRKSTKSNFLFSKQKFPREVSRNFQVLAQEKQAKYDVKLHYFFFKLWPPASFMVHLQVRNYKSVINWYSLNWFQKDERLSGFKSGNLWICNPAS